MNDIYVTRIPVPGDELELWTTDVSGPSNRKELTAVVRVEKVETRLERVWNPVLRTEETVEATYGRLLYKGRPLLRRLLLGGTARVASPRGFYREAPDDASAGESLALPRD